MKHKVVLEVYTTIQIMQVYRQEILFIAHFVNLSSWWKTVQFRHMWRKYKRRNMWSKHSPEVRNHVDLDRWLQVPWIAWFLGMFWCVGWFLQVSWMYQNLSTYNSHCMCSQARYHLKDNSFLVWALATVITVSLKVHLYWTL